ncbi:MAG: site-2 protease family protein [Myxococcota bacterium]
MGADASSRDSGVTNEQHDEPSVLWPLALFLATVLCVFHAGALLAAEGPIASSWKGFFDPAFLASGAPFAIPLLAILITHEFGHYIAARLHGLPASLPYFIPLPVFGLFGTLGALIGMRDEIRSRNALLDVGAAGPLAGLVVAIPTLVWGLLHSTIEPALETGYLQEGESILYFVLKRVLLAPIPPGHDVFLHPTGTAGWAGLLITMLNLLPWGQLDGGHIAYALFGERQHRLARWFRRGLLLLFAYNLVRFVGPVLLGHSKQTLGEAFFNSISWLVWFGALHVVERASGSAEHPPYEPGPLSPARRVVGWLCIALFVLLFMPTPMAQY